MTKETGKEKGQDRLWPEGGGRKGLLGEGGAEENEPEVVIVPVVIADW